MFKDLPECVLSVLLSCWLHIEDVAVLDSACCSRTTRNDFLRLCQQKAFSFLHTSHVDNDVLMPWLIVRRFHADSITYDADTNVSLLMKFLDVSGTRLRSVVLSHLKVDSVVASAISMIALYCPSIADLRFCHCVVDILLLEMLANCTMKVIVFDWCVFEESSLEGAEIAYLRCVRNFIIRSYSSVTYGHQLIANLLELFPSVLVIQIHSASITHDDMIQIVKSCPNVKKFTCNHSKSLMERSMKVAVASWALQTLSLRDCGVYSDELLDTISGGRCATTLVSFLFRFAAPIVPTAIAGSNTFTAKVIEQLLRICPHLTTIALGWHPINSREFAEIIAPRLGNILVLVLAQGLCSDEAFYAVGKYCSRLEVLDLYDDMNVGHLTIPALD